MQQSKFGLPVTATGCTCKNIEIIENFVQQMLSNHQSINQCLLSIQTNNNNIHTFINMNTERQEKK